jgi:3-oxoacyl-[acyl-carrier protein] reductase
VKSIENYWFYGILIFKKFMEVQMDLKIKNKIAVVTASSKGLGKGTAEALAAEGCNLVICSRNRENISETSDYIRSKYNIEVLPVVCDVLNPEDIEALREKTISRFKTCHILFTNAGGPKSGKIDDFESNDFKQALDLNLFSTINLVYAFLPYMKAQQWGRILASTSTNVKQLLPSYALSNVSRVGVQAFIKSLSMEVAAYHITANILAPGYIMTELIKNMLENQCSKEDITYDEALKRLEDKIPTHSIGKPEDFGALAAFLASEQASYITGETFLIDGGMYSGLM